MGGIEARALGVLQQVPERPCYIATRTGPQTAINCHGAIGSLRTTTWNLDGTLRRRRWTASFSEIRKVLRVRGEIPGPALAAAVAIRQIEKRALRRARLERLDRLSDDL